VRLLENEYVITIGVDPHKSTALMEVTHRPAVRLRIDATLAAYRQCGAG
jgi:hypothetical protein